MGAPAWVPNPMVGGIGDGRNDGGGGQPRKNGPMKAELCMSVGNLGRELKFYILLCVTNAGPENNER